MDTKALQWSEDISAPLIEHYSFADPTANTVKVGTGHFLKGQRMPDQGYSIYNMREITIILEGSIKTTIGDENIFLKAGDIVTIPQNAKQFSHFTEDTKLIYLFFGNAK